MLAQQAPREPRKVVWWQAAGSLKGADEPKRSFARNNRCHSEFLALHRRPSRNVIPAHPQARKGRQTVLKNANAGVKIHLGPKSIDTLPHL